MLTLQDSVNMLYVAMTRAEKALFINAEMPKDMPLKISHIAGLCFPEKVQQGILKAEIKLTEVYLTIIVLNESKSNIGSCC